MYPDSGIDNAFVGTSEIIAVGVEQNHSFAESCTLGNGNSVYTFGNTGLIGDLDSMRPADILQGSASELAFD